MLVWAALLDVCLISSFSCCSRDLRDEGSANASPGVVSPRPLLIPAPSPPQSPRHAHPLCFSSSWTFFRSSWFWAEHAATLPGQRQAWVRGHAPGDMLAHSAAGTHLLSSPSRYSFFLRRLSWADCLFRIFLLTFFRIRSSA